MTTPNVEELITYLQGLANEIEIPYPMEVIEEAAEVLQSQAERIAELERESETHAKAYGLAIVERDNLRNELKTAQEGWRCECSTDDACRFARERDALRAELAEIAADEPVMFAYEYSDGSWHDASSTEHSAGMKPLFTRPMPAQLEAIAAAEPVYYEFQWTNPGNQPDQPESVFVWARVEPAWNGTVQQKVDELLAYRYDDKPTYRVRALFTRPMPAQDVTELVEALQLFADALPLERSTIKTCYAVTDQMRDAAHAALSKYKGAK